MYFDLKLPRESIDSGKLSSLQLESVVYACQQHMNILADGTRAGFLVGKWTTLTVFICYSKTNKVPILQIETTKMSYYNLRYCVSLFVLCHIPDAWAYRVQNKGKKKKEKSRKWFRHSFADLCVFIILRFVVSGMVY